MENKTIEQLNAEYKQLIADLKTANAAEADAIKGRVEALESILSTPKTPAVAKNVDAEAREVIRAMLKSNVVTEKKTITGVTRGTALSQGEGYSLVAPEFYSEVLKYITAFSPIRQYAKVVQMGSDIMNVPIRDGIPTAAWVDETTARAETTGTSFTNVALTAYEASADVPVSKKMLEDAAFPVEQYIAEAIGEAIGKLEGTAFVAGNGTSAPQGLTSPDAAITTAANNAITFDEVLDLEAALDQRYRANAVWVMHPEIVNYLRKLKITTNSEYIVQRDMSNPLVKTILGHPVIESPDMQALNAGAIVADKKTIVLANLGEGYMVADRIGLEFLVDPYTNRPFVTVNGRKRVAGGVVKAEAIKVLAVKA